MPISPVTLARRTPDASPAKLKRADHLRLWRIVEGAVLNAFREHPEYLTEAGAKSAVQSVTKRVVGEVVALASEVRKDAPGRVHYPGGLGSPREAVPTAARGPDECDHRQEGGRVSSPPPSDGN